MQPFKFMLVEELGELSSPQWYLKNWKLKFFRAVGFWAGWTDELVEGTFIDPNTGEELYETTGGFHPYHPGEPNGGELENCIQVLQIRTCLTFVAWWQNLYSTTINLASGVAPQELVERLQVRLQGGLLLQHRGAAEIQDQRYRLRSVFKQAWRVYNSVVWASLPVSVELQPQPSAGRPAWCHWLNKTGDDVCGMSFKW